MPEKPILTKNQIHIIWGIVAAILSSGGVYMGNSTSKSEDQVRQEIRDSLIAVNVGKVSDKIDRLDTSMVKLKESRFRDSLDMARYMEKTDTMIAEIKRVSANMKSLKAQGEMGLAWARK